MKLTGDITRFTPMKLTESLNESVLVELASGQKFEAKGLMVVRGIVQRYDVVNANGRRYSQPLWTRTLADSRVKEMFETRSMLGHLEHPEDGRTRLDRVPSHVMLSAVDDGKGNIIGEALVLDTDTGRNLAGIFRGGCSVGISSRGDGETQVKESFHEVIPESFVLTTWDFVFDNSVPGARPKPVTEGTEKKPVVEVSSIGGTPAAGGAPGGTPAGGSPKPDDPRERSYQAWLKETGQKDSEEARSAFYSKNESQRPSDVKKTQESTTQKTMKLPEMRKIEASLLMLPKASAVRNLSFSQKVSMSESLLDFRGKIAALVTEDGSLKAFGDKLLKTIGEAEDEMEKAPEAPAPKVSKEDYTTIVRPFVARCCQGAEPEALDAAIGKLFTAYESGEPADLEAIFAECTKPAEGGEGGEGAPAAAVGESLDSALSLVAALSTKLKASSPKKVTEMRSLLREARVELEKATTMRGLLKEAKTELERLEAVEAKKTEYEGLLKEAQAELERLEARIFELDPKAKEAALEEKKKKDDEEKKKKDEKEKEEKKKKDESLTPEQKAAAALEETKKADQAKADDAKKLEDQKKADDAKKLQESKDAEEAVGNHTTLRLIRERRLKESARREPLKS